MPAGWVGKLRPGGRVTLDPGVLDPQERTLVSISPQGCGDFFRGGVRFVGANAYWCTRDMCPPLIYIYIYRLRLRLSLLLLVLRPLYGYVQVSVT